MITQLQRANYITKSIIAFVLVAVLVSPLTLSSQISSGRTPPGFSTQTFDHLVVTHRVPAPETDALLKEDALAGKWGVAERIGILLPAQINVADHGAWTTLADGSRQWRIRMGSEDAKQLALYFEDFYLPRGYQLFIYNDSRSKLIGAFTHLNNHESGLFATEPLPGESIIVELIASPQVTEQASFTISEVLYVYRSQDHGLKQFGRSGNCNVNVNCSEGFDWQDEKRGVVKIHSRVGGSVFRCSGSLVNNTRYDYLPYIFTADHCSRTGSTYSTEDDFNQWVFFFNYEADECPNPTNEPASVSLTGATLKANIGGGNANMGSDFCLLLLNEDVPPSVMPYYNGWSRVDIASPSGVSIHHPSGDIKKISTYTEPLLSSNWNSNTLNMYWQVRWSPTQNGHGITEGGSSGSPIFSNEGLIVGQLTGGQASCNNPNAPDYYGKFAVSWESNGDTATKQLKPWLDPDNTGVDKLNGSYDVTQVVSFFLADTTALQAGGRIGFQDISINEPTEWHWIFKGGEPSESFQKNPGQITYNSFGSYDVTLIVKNELSSDTLVRNKYINVTPGMFPNPARNQLTMLLGNHGDEELRFEITDITGRPVTSWRYKIAGLYSVNINTTGLSNGAYIITAISDDNSFSRQKLIIAR
jgi:hypothetical protein